MGHKELVEPGELLEREGLDLSEDVESVSTMAQSLIPPPAKMDMLGDTVSNWQYFRTSGPIMK